MKLLTIDRRERLLKNGQLRAELSGKFLEPEPDFPPVVKLFTPDANCTWLLTELDPEDPDIAFGLCDLGMGCPELGYLSISELESVRGALGLPVERDRHFIAQHPLSIYTHAARIAGAITEDANALAQAESTIAAGGAS